MAGGMLQGSGLENLILWTLFVAAFVSMAAAYVQVLTRIDAPPPMDSVRRRNHAKIRHAARPL